MNTTLICLLTVMALPIILALSTIPFRFAQFGKPDLHQPRLQASQLEGAGSRLDAAQKNAWEALMLFSSALIFAALTGTELSSLGTAALLFVVARVLHAIFYFFNLGILRFLAFMTSIASIIWIVVIAQQSL